LLAFPFFSLLRGSAASNQSGPRTRRPPGHTLPWDLPKAPHPGHLYRALADGWVCGQVRVAHDRRKPALLTGRSEGEKTAIIKANCGFGQLAPGPDWWARHPQAALGGARRAETGAAPPGPPGNEGQTRISRGTSPDALRWRNASLTLVSCSRRMVEYYGSDPDDPTRAVQPPPNAWNNATASAYRLASAWMRSISACSRFRSASSTASWLTAPAS